MGNNQRVPQMIEGLARQNLELSRKFELDIEKKFGLMTAEMAKLQREANGE